jgi:hypothetical protein
MQIARLQSEKSVADVVARVYSLKPGDPRAAAAEKALLAANPHLSTNVAALPAGTPVVVPAVPGINAISTATVDPQRAAWISMMEELVASAQQASNAQQTGVATTAPTTPSSQRTKALTLLKDDIAQFKKIH